MEIEQGKLEFRTDYSELKLTGALNYDMYRKMSKEELCDFIKRDAAELAYKFVSKEWLDAVHIRCEYVVIDSYYHVTDKVAAHLAYTHESGVIGDVLITKGH